MKLKLHNSIIAIRNFSVISVISGVFLLTPLTPGFAASCTATVNWSTGWCSICGGPNGNYACNPPWSGSGDWVCKGFANCVPAGNIVTQVCYTLFWVGCTGNVTLTLNGTSIGTTQVIGSCPCGGCVTSTVCSGTFSCPGGFPGYNYSGTNNICPSTNGTVCIDRATITMTYMPSQPPQPGAISGPTSPCVGSVQTYSIAAVSGATSYNWTVPGGWTINSGQGTTSISVTVGSGSGNVCVQACNSCGCSAFTCLFVAPISAPAAPGAITGPGTPCANTAQTYSISSVPGATSYTWTVPGGWTINSGQGTTSINVTVGSTDGNVCVRSCNACACSAFTCRFIDVQLPPVTPGAISGPASPCANTSQTYSISAVTGATSYQWTVPGGWTINSGQGTTSINVTVGSGSGNVCVRACNGCGCSSFQCMFVAPGNPPVQPNAISGPSPVARTPLQLPLLPAAAAGM